MQICHCISVAFKLSLPGITVSDGVPELPTAWAQPGCQEVVAAGTAVGQGALSFQVGEDMDMDRMKPVVHIPIYPCA